MQIILEAKRDSSWPSLSSSDKFRGGGTVNGVLHAVCSDDNRIVSFSV